MDFQTTINQLGGRMFTMMTAASYYKVNENTLRVKFKGSKNANCMDISLNENDLYNVKFIKIWGANVTYVDSASDLYCDQLQSYFTEVTKLYTTL